MSYHFKPQLIVSNFKIGAKVTAIKINISILWSIYTHESICQGDKSKGKIQELENRKKKMA
jgi:hypothetical protein